MGRIWIATSEDFLRVLQGLLPRGLIWTREPGRRLTRLLLGMADEFARAHNRAADLVEEADPQTTTAAGLLSDWERVLRLPEAGYIPTGETDRRAVVCGKLSARGGQSLIYFKALATTLGATDVDAIDGPFPYVWTVSLPDNMTRFRAGSACGTPLVTFDEVAQRIKWFFEKYKPAHTAIVWID